MLVQKTMIKNIITEKNDLMKWKNKDSFLDLRKTLLKKSRLKKISNIENRNKKKIIIAVKS